MQHTGFGNTAPKDKLIPNPKTRLREQVREAVWFNQFGVPASARTMPLKGIGVGMRD